MKMMRPWHVQQFWDFRWIGWWWWFVICEMRMMRMSGEVRDGVLPHHHHFVLGFFLHDFFWEKREERETVFRMSDCIDCCEGEWRVDWTQTAAATTILLMVSSGVVGVECFKFCVCPWVFMSVRWGGRARESGDFDCIDSKSFGRLRV